MPKKKDKGAQGAEPEINQGACLGTCISCSDMCAYLASQEHSAHLCFTHRFGSGGSE